MPSPSVPSPVPAGGVVLEALVEKWIAFADDETRPLHERRIWRICGVDLRAELGTARLGDIDEVLDRSFADACVGRFGVPYVPSSQEERLRSLVAWMEPIAAMLDEQGHHADAKDVRELAALALPRPTPHPALVDQIENLPSQMGYGNLVARDAVLALVRAGTGSVAS